MGAAAEADKLADGEMDALSELEGLIDALSEAEGLMEAETEGLTLGETEGLTDADSPACGAGLIIGTAE